jgi:hypothetical protein
MLTWEEPPEVQKGGRPKYAGPLEELRRNPKRWARIGQGPNRDTMNAARRYILHEAKYASPGEFEVVVRRMIGGYGLFAQYIGEEPRND